MSEFAGNLSHRLISVFNLIFESSAHNSPKELKAENQQTAEQVGEFDAAAVGETSSSPAKSMSVLQQPPMSVESVTSGVVERDCDLIVAEKHCLMTSSEENVDDLIAFVGEKLQFLNERGLEQIVSDESPKVRDFSTMLMLLKVTLAKRCLCAQSCHTAVVCSQVRGDCLLLLT